MNSSIRSESRFNERNTKVLRLRYYLSQRSNPLIRPVTCHRCQTRLFKPTIDLYPLHLNRVGRYYDCHTNRMNSNGSECVTNMTTDEIDAVTYSNVNARLRIKNNFNAGT